MMRSCKTRKWPLITLTAAGAVVGFLFFFSFDRHLGWTSEDDAGRSRFRVSNGSVGFSDTRYLPLESMAVEWDVLVAHIDDKSLPLILPRTTQEFGFPGFRWERSEWVNRRAARGEKDRVLAIDLWLPAALLMAYPFLYFLFKPVRTFFRTSRRGKKVAQICIVIGIGTAGVMLLFYKVTSHGLPASASYIGHDFLSWAIGAVIFSALVFALQLPRTASHGAQDSKDRAALI